MLETTFLMLKPATKLRWTKPTAEKRTNKANDVDSCIKKIRG